MTTKKLFAVLCTCSLFTIPGCTVKVYDPITGKPLFEGEIENSPSPERARELFAQLEDGLRRNLEALREARSTQNEEAQNICMDNLQRAADHKQKLTLIMNS